MIGEPSFAGIVGLTNTAFTLRVSFTQPLKQWTVRFALDSMVKNTLIWRMCVCRCRRIRCCRRPPRRSAGADAEPGGGFALPGLRRRAICDVCYRP